jgi:AbiV family abortive infection protein
MTGILSEGFLIQGAFYAVEQAGHLLHDAVLLFNRGRYASSLVLDTFSREEMGRARILLNNASKVQKGGAVYASPLSKELSGGRRKTHLPRLSAGQRSVRVALNQLFGRFLSPPDPGSRTGILREVRISGQEFAQAMQQFRGELADQTLQMRKRALYTDLIQSGTRWNRPAEAGRREALALLEAVSRDYRADRSDYRRFQKRIERTNAFGYCGWPSRPDLPTSVFPKRSTRQTDVAKEG